MLTRGQIVLEDREGIDRGVVWTKHGPITKGNGHGELADVDDVTVYVDGSEANVIGINPIKGAIILEDLVDFESEVKIDYNYTENPILEMQSKSQNGNHFQSGSKQGNRFYYEGHFANTPYQSRPQPKQRSLSFTAWDHDYTTTFNDPTTARFNQPVFSSAIRPFKYDLERIELAFEGQDHPTSQSEFSYHGPPLPSPEIRNGAYVLRDDISSNNNIDGNVAYFTSSHELQYPRRTDLRFRLQINSVNEKDRDFTGVSVGWASDDNLIFLGFLEKGGLQHAAILTDGGDESSLLSYSGISGRISPNDQTILNLESFVDLSSGDQIRVDDHIFTVDQVNNQEITLASNNQIAAGKSVEVYPPIDYNSLTSYRLSETLDGDVEVQVGAQNTIATAESSETPDTVEVFQEIDSNQFFFGSVSNQSESVSEWDFFRASSFPPRRNLQGRIVRVHDPFINVLPDHAPNPWVVSDNQGFWSLDDHENLVVEQGGQENNGTIGFHRIEPFLTNDAVVSFGTEVKVESWADGFPAHFTFADQRKEVTLGLFAEEPSNEATAKIGFGGVESFVDEGWTVQNGSSTDETFIDHYVNTSYDGSSVFEASRTKDLSRNNFQDSPDTYLFSGRIRINSYDLNGQNQSPIYFGVDNGDREVYIRPVKDGIQFVNRNGTNLFQSPIDYTGWKDGEFHTYRVAVDSGIVNLFVDSEFQNSVNLGNFPVGDVSNSEFKLSLKNEGGKIDYDIDYLFSHDLNYTSPGDRKIGLYRGGSLFDSDSYDFIDFDWMSDSLDVEILHDDNNTEVYLDGDKSVDFDIPYEKLPDRNDRDSLNTDLGFVQFGSLDDGAYARTKWDHIHYKIENRREDQSSITESRFNRAHAITSPEPVYAPDFEQDVFTSEDEKTVDLSQKSYNIQDIIQVKSEDGSTVYDFDYDSDHGLVHIQNATLPSEKADLLLTFSTEEPHTEDYIKKQNASTVLYEETPYFAESDRAEVETETEWYTAFNSGDAFNTDEDATFSDNRRRISYSIVSERCPLYDDLDVIEEEDDGLENIIAPAYDEETFNRFSVRGYRETYNLPDPVNPGFRSEDPLTLDDRADLLDDSRWILDGLTSDPSQRSEVVATLYQDETENYDKVEDELQGGTVTDYDGAVLLDVQGYQLDDTPNEDGYGELDSTSTSVTSISFNSTFNWP